MQPISCSISGLSPLARGNHRRNGPRDRGGGPIPARTGQPVTAQMFEDAFGAYPRSHGATSCVVPASFTDKGLSPLARGNLPEAESARAALRPIPARTGQPTASRCLPLLWRAYPRSHGATEWGRTERAKIGGLSPLARGNPRLARLQSACARPIPARTGQPCSKPMRRVFERAYPRSHGATSWQVSDLLLSQGLSPLARGNRTASDAQIALKGPIPARTGQPHISCAQCSASRAYPRSHGATSTHGSVVLVVAGLSPLARGNQAVRMPTGSRYGPIPARTGQPSYLSTRRSASGAYPRSHGATR